jgi:ABC-2 type transport system permease protein
MNAALVAARAGLSRGWIEFRQTLTTPRDLISILITTGTFLAVMIWTRHTHVPGTHFSLGTATLVSVLALDVVYYGVVNMGDLIVVEREDGTLLRAKAIPNGMLGYLLGKVVNFSGQIAFVVAVTLLVGAFLFTGLAIGSPGSWLTLAWVLALGLLATLPLGAVLGSLFPSQRSAGPWWVLMLSGLAAISGIFYPITHLPVFLQWTGQVFPMYWLGLGMRSALLPNAMAAVEVGHSWRHLASFGVLSAWAVTGLVLAPAVLRRMARRSPARPSRPAARRRYGAERPASERIRKT